MKFVVKLCCFFIFLLFSGLSLFSQETQNYIIEKTYKDTVDDVSITVNYFDGLGRPIQSIQVGGSPEGKDVIQHKAYDDLGREVKKYLPYASDYSGGFFRDNAETEQDDFYKSQFKSPNQSVNPWSDIVYELSPLNRIMEQGAPGIAYQAKGDEADNAVHFSYETNANEVKFFKVDENGNLTINGVYQAATLYKTGTRDENGVWGYEYKDLLGQVVLKVSDPTGLNLQTYYVYDDYGLQRYIIPPKATELITQTTGIIDSDLINKLCYYYKYDGRKRKTIKKLPGADSIYMVYDNRDRLVLTQDGNLREIDKWIFTKYDALNRPVITGIYTHTATINQDSMQTVVNKQMVNFYESINGTFNSADFGYTNQSFPTTNIEILTVTYYDNYGFDINPVSTYSNIRTYAESIDDSDYPVSKINYAVKGQITGSKTRILGTDDFLTTLVLYNDKYRPIRTYVDNYLGGDDLLLTKYDFIGNVLKTKQIHYKDENVATPIVVNQRLIYDHANRLTQVYHQIEGNEEVLLSEMSYNELGQLVKKKLNENADGSFLQEIDYEYNIRGWKTKINDPDNLGNDKFAMELLYNTTLPNVNNAGDEQYNGNIAAVRWNTPEFGMKAYGYGYDEINRLERAKFAAGTALNTDVNKYSVENTTYDANGNILTLGRHNTAAGYIDNLTMTYDGNQLKKTHDSGDFVLGFYDGVDTETEYSYDHNGNMDIDDNKGFVFAYNYLNLPKEVVGGNDTVRFIYDAVGIKLSKELAQNGAISYMDYIGNFVYKDGDLDYILTSEGRVTEPVLGTLQYEYFLKDHLDNTRVVFADGNSDGVVDATEVLQENHYYPFGSSIGDLAVDRGADNKIKYYGKELQDDALNGIKLNLYDYNTRYYMPDVPVFTTQDLLAEDYSFQSTYAYAINNPIRYTDFLGMGPDDKVKDEEEKKKEEEKKEEKKKDEPTKDEKKENVWEKYGMTKEEWDKLNPTHKEWIIGANEFSETLNETGSSEAQIENNQNKVDWWTGYSEGAMDVAQQSLTDSDISRGGRSFGYTVVSVMTKDSVKKYQRKVDSLTTIKDSLINQMNNLLKNK